MSRANLPRQQALALGKMTYCAWALSANPVVYGVSPADAAALQAAVDDFSAAFAAGNPVANRTRVDVAVKDEAFARADQAFRRAYSRIKWNDAVGDVDKMMIGVTPVNRE